MSFINAFSAHYLFSALFENNIITTSINGKTIEEWCTENDTEILNLIVYAHTVVGRPAEYVRSRSTVNYDACGIRVEFTLVDSNENYHDVILTGSDPDEVPDRYTHW